MSLQTTMARASARIAEQRWQEHRKTCSRCRPRQPCADGREALQQRDESRAEAKRQAELDAAPDPNQGTLFDLP